MNLVKLQDELKMLPLPILTAKSQGQDPQVPPWLATAVLNERIDAQKKAGMAQGAAQGEQPSINEQLNQKAGLMALQGQQQQQAQQQMMSQMAQAPQPAPENVPQPEQQPEPQMMARGGLARLPVDSRMFDYRSGGIIGFSGVESSEVPEAAAIDTQRVEAAARAKKIKELEAKAKFLRDAGAPQAAQVEAELAALTQPASPPPASISPAGLPSVLPQRPGQPRVDMAAPPSPPPAAAPRPRVAPATTAPTPPTGIQTALPQAAPAQSELEKMQMDALRKEPTARTLADIQAERKAATPELLNEPAGLAQLARLKQQQEQYEKGKEGRAKENWMRGLAAAARGGIGGFGTSYLETAEGGRTADAAQAAYQDKVMTAIEAARRGEATTEQTALLAAMGGERAAQAEAAGKRLTAIGTARNTEAQTQVAGLDRASREKVAELDREMRERHYRAPIVASTEKERFIKEYMKTGLSYTAALAKVMEVLGESKASIASGRIDAKTRELLAAKPRYVNAKMILADPSRSAEHEKALRTVQIEEELAGVPSSSAPTITPAQTAALAKYGAK